MRSTGQATEIKAQGLQEAGLSSTGYGSFNDDAGETV
jgi:hypothetical protein